MQIRRISSSPGLRVTLVMCCLFGLNGVGMPFLPKWLAETRGLNGVEIGAVMCGAQLVRMLIGPPIAAWADGFADRRDAIRILALGAALAYAAFVPAHGFVVLAAVGFFAMGLASANTPLLEGAALRAGRAGDVSFGVSRAIGSIAFVVGNIAGGALISRFGINAAIVWVIAASTAMFAASWALKPDPAPPSAATHNFYSRLVAALALFKQRRFALAMIASGLVQAAHAFYYGFSSLAWTQQGFGAATIGALWAVGVIAEVILFTNLRSIEPRVTPERLVMIGAAGALVRWGAMAFSPPLWLLWPLQIIHAATFTATHVGALRIVEREAPPELAGSGMVLYAMLAAGTPMGLATLGSGWLYDHFGAGGYGVMALMAAIGLMVAVRLVMAPAARTA